MRRALIQLSNPDLGILKRVNCFVPDDRTEMLLGLTQFQLHPEEGMLFNFYPPQPPIMSMRGMSYPIDVLFIMNKTVIQIAEEIPITWFTIGINQPCEAVLEMNAGWCRRNGIQEGAQVLVLP